MRILVIEDDQILSQNLKSILTRATYAVDVASTAVVGIQKASDEQYDLFVIDWMLPDGEGPNIIADLRGEGITAPILMLTARSQTEDTVKGLDVGADDYLTKPFTKDILLARIRSLFRRMHTTPQSPVLTIDDLMIDTNTHEITRGGKTINLSPKEYSLLQYLASHKGKAIDRITILSHVWDEQADPFSNTIDVHMRYLRKKIDDGHKKQLLQTVKGKGYMLCD